MIILATLVAVLIYCISNRIKIRGAEIVGDTPSRHSGPDLHGCESISVALDRWPTPLQHTPLTQPRFRMRDPRSLYDGRGSPPNLRAETICNPTRLDSFRSKWVSSCAARDEVGRTNFAQHIYLCARMSWNKGLPVWPTWVGFCPFGVHSIDPDLKCLRCQPVDLDKNSLRLWARVLRVILMTEDCTARISRTDTPV